MLHDLDANMQGTLQYWKCLNEKLTLLKSLPNKNCEIFLGNFCIVCMAEGLIYMTPTNLKIVYAWVSTGHFCNRVLKLGCARICMSVLAERKVPQRRNYWLCDEFMINYDGYFVLCMTWFM